MIKPAFFKHAELYEAEHATGMPLRVAFAGLWTVADRAGRFRWKIDLKPDVLPFDQIDMMAVLDALEKYGFIRSYVIDGKRYGLIPSFSEHQTFHKTERHSTLPAPCFNGEPTVRHTADTGTVTGTELVVDDLGDESDSVPSEPALTALYLSIWANGAVTEKWGEQPSPYTHGSAATLADALRNAGVEPEIARLSIYRQCRESRQRVPPRGVNYFREGIMGDWSAEGARRQFKQSGEVPPAPSATVRPSGTTARQSPHDGAGRGALLFTEIRKMVREERPPGQPVHRFIRKTDVAKLGADALLAYEAIGGSDRVLACTGETVGFVIRDFTVALQEAARDCTHV